jgi:hypothetical protein
MMTLRASVAAAIITGAVAGSAGITYVATKASMNVTVSCPAPAAAAPPASRPFPPRGDVPPTTGGKQW